ncbi:hypothetical protein BD309DRAFT_945943 [Dichomitus squalens]|nr:hypothetical protein BD309DRAFT_945943 [Dichomitus squalens]
MGRSASRRCCPRRQLSLYACEQALNVFSSLFLGAAATSVASTLSGRVPKAAFSVPS